MRIRNILAIAFVITALVPSALLALWSYKHGVDREFDEVKDRHLLLAQNLSAALQRYHTDIAGSIDSISQGLLAGNPPRNLRSLMDSIALNCVVLVESKTGKSLARTDALPKPHGWSIPERFIHEARLIAQTGVVTYSRVLEGRNGNVMLAVRRYGNKLSIGILKTDYFVKLGASISFGVKGHAAIVDHRGNVLAHPLPSWIASRKNISKVSAVRWMMRGETGIEQFYSPALKGDMIAGLTAVKGTGWGVMIPQPVSELYAKVWENNKAFVLAAAVGTLFTFCFVLLFLNSLVTPLERFLIALKSNARNREISQINFFAGLIPLREIREMQINFNLLARRISAANRRVNNMAYIDHITQLPNRAKLEDLASRLFSDQNAVRAGGSIVFIDIDDFKQINDVHGHSKGDEYLAQIGNRIRNVVNNTARHVVSQTELTHRPIVARIGGDEFAVLFPGLTEEGPVTSLLDDLNYELSTPSGDFAFDTVIGSSIGCARFPQNGTNLPTLMKLADIAMYHAKKAGKNRHQLYTVEIGTMTDSEMSNAVSHTIKNGEMSLEYQPIVDAHTHKTRNVEALVRWNHPELGYQSPDKWLPAIATTSVIRDLDEWVIDRAMKDQLTWKENGLLLRVAVNVGATHFCQPDFAMWLANQADCLGFDPKDMEIEITEDMLFGSQCNANQVLQQVHKSGFGISIDDFGTGFSNMARLTQLPVDTIKIDRSLISQVNENKRIGALISCIGMMARSLGCEAVAEGLETAEQVAFAEKEGMQYLQGWFFSKSLKSEDLIAWIADREAGEEKDSAAA